MKVTGIISCYNYSDLVGQSIHSFLEQDYERKSLIVIDDGSSDDSWEKIKSFSGGEMEIFSLDAPRGVSFVKNLAINLAWDKTDAFAILDADDRYEKTFLSKSIELVKNHKKVGIVYSDEVVEDHYLGRTFQNLKPAFNLNRLRSNYYVGGNYLLTKDALRSAGRFDENLPVLAEYDMCLRVSESHLIMHLPHPLISINITNRALRNRIPHHIWDQCREVIGRKVIGRHA